MMRNSHSKMSRNRKMQCINEPQIGDRRVEILIDQDYFTVSSNEKRLNKGLNSNF